MSNNVFRDIVQEASRPEEPEPEVQVEAEATPAPEEAVQVDDVHDEGEDEAGEDYDEEEISAEGAEEEEAVEEESPAPEPKEEKFVVKIDGEESEVSAEELVRNYQISTAAERRLGEATQRQAQVEEVAQQMQADPFGTLFKLYNANLKDPNLAQKKLFDDAIEFVKPFIEEQALPEEERRVKQKERELQWDERNLQEQRAALAREQDNRQFEVNRKKIMSEVDEAIGSVGLDQYQGDDARKTITYRIIRLMAAQQEADASNPLSAQKAAEFVKSDVEREVKSLLGTLPLDEIERVNPEALKTIRKQNLQQARKKRSTRRGAAAKQPTKAVKARAKSEAQTSREFFNNLVAEAEE